MKVSMREVLEDAEMFVDFWAAKTNIKVVQVQANVHLAYDKERRAFERHEAISAARSGAKPVRIRPLTKHLLDCAYEIYSTQIPKRLRESLAPTFIGHKENLEPLKAWLMAVTGEVRDDDLNIMAHWLWLVKRNLAGLPVVWHIMPIITSPKQGGGKSTAIRALCKPLEDLMLELEISQVVDERSFTMFGNYLINFFDEMAGADKVEINAFKKNITSATLSYRPMRTNTQVKIQNMCSSIGSTNNQVFDMFKDPTGIRRFFPINSLDQLNWEGVNAIDYMALWRGIDETKPRGYYENVKDTVMEKQAGLAMKDEVEMFVEDYLIKPQGPKTMPINGKTLYNQYLVNAKNSGVSYHVTRQTFYKKLQVLGVPGERKRDDNRSFSWFFTVNADAVLMPGSNQ